MVIPLFKKNNLNDPNPKLDNDPKPFDIGKYKLKVYHMDDDEFRGTVYPQSSIDYIRYRWFNRKYFRVL